MSVINYASLVEVKSCNIISINVNIHTKHIYIETESLILNLLLLKKSSTREKNIIVASTSLTTSEQSKIVTKTKET